MSLPVPSLLAFSSFSSLALLSAALFSSAGCIFSNPSMLLRNSPINSSPLSSPCLTNVSGEPPELPLLPFWWDGLGPNLTTLSSA